MALSSPEVSKVRLLPDFSQPVFFTSVFATDGVESLLKHNWSHNTLLENLLRNTRDRNKKKGTIRRKTEMKKEKILYTNTKQEERDEERHEKEN